MTLEFVPHNIGPNHLSRNEWLNEYNTVTKMLYANDDDSKLILITDGTYCYCEKSSNYEFQRDSYSTQKKRHLLKPFIICSSNGRILDIYGFYEASKNDAKIIQDIFETDDMLKNLIKKMI